MHFKSFSFVHVLLAFLVLGPLLLPGYILTLDMVFVPELAAPEQVTNVYLFRWLLHLLNIIIPSQIIQKIFLFSILVLSGAGAYRLAMDLRAAHKKLSLYDKWGTYAAGALYMINPYTYSRFMAGQSLVLLGYALMPFFVRALFGFLDEPAWRSGLKLTLWALLISLVSIHTLGLIALVTLLTLALKICSPRFRENATKVAKYGLAGLGIFVLMSSYWLVPLLAGKGQTAETIARFGAGDQQAFRTLGEGIAGQLSNVLRLQGFWAEGQGHYFLPQDNLPGWGLVALAVWLLVILGGFVLWKSYKSYEAGVLLASGTAAAVISIGPVNAWLAEGLPLFAGFREPHKFVGLIALLYAVFAGRAVAHLAKKYSGRFGETGAYSVLAAITLLIVMFTPNMFWGFGGQLRPVQYPDDWFSANARLNQDNDDFHVLFLPWHLYMHFDFAGRIIANPADKFFDKPVIISDNPEFGDTALASSDPVKRRLDKILAQAAGSDDLGKQLSRLNIKYVFLAKEADAGDYSYLNDQNDLRLVQESATLKLYRNEVWWGK